MRLGSWVAGAVGLWCRPAAVALIQTLVWELPYAADVALKKKRGIQCLMRALFLLHKLRSFQSPHKAEGAMDASSRFSSFWEPVPSGARQTSACSLLPAS